MLEELKSLGLDYVNNNVYRIRENEYCISILNYLRAKRVIEYRDLGKRFIEIVPVNPETFSEEVKELIEKRGVYIKLGEI